MAKILIIDDEPGMRQVIGKILSPRGHAMLYAEDGAQGLNLCAAESPDLVLVDMRLPDMDGADILKGLRAARPQMPVIVLAGFGDVDAAAELVKLGARDYLSKPFKVDDLVHLVMRTLGLREEPPPPPPLPPSDATAAPPADAAAPSPAGNEAAPGDAPLPVISPSAAPSKKILLYAAAAAAPVLLAAGYFILKAVFAAPSYAEFSLPYSNPSSLSWDGKQFWTSDWMEGKVYRHARGKTFPLETSYPTPDIEPAGLASDGKNLWVSHTLGQKIYQYKIGSSGLSAVTSAPSPGPAPSGLLFDGKNLWSLDFQQAKVYKHRPDAKLTVVASYDSPAANPGVLFAYKGFFFIGDSKTGRMYKVRPKNFTVAGVYLLPGYENQDRHIAGAAWDGKNLWTCADGVAKVIRRRIQDLKPVKG